MNNDSVFDYDEGKAARILMVSQRTLRSWRKLGKIGYHRTPGGRIRYTLDQLVDFQRATRVEAAFCRTFPESAAQR